MAVNGSMMNEERKQKWLSFGAPKGSGKSTFAMTAPGTKLVLQYDLGSATFPPGTDPNTFWIQTYADSDTGGLHSGIASDKWKKSKIVYGQVITDLDNIVDAFNKNASKIVLHDGTDVPMPDTIILDGLVRLDHIVVDGFCAINNITDPGEAVDARGNAGGGAQKFWGRRLANVNKLFSLAISLPCNVGMITWEDVKYAADQKGQLQVIAREPDIGGRLNVWGPGLTDAVFYHHGQGGKFYVRTQPTGEIQRVGVRNAYKIPALVDVTITGTPGEKLPFDRVFDYAKQEKVLS